ncbi:MAG: GNAT family N-acetyltransferase [Dehalococcoidales bacterium]|nr:GNAT family N-acetyltransferase [Dehalococcoidales bacterium]
MKIKSATTQKEKEELDRLLWDVLWKPLNLPRDIRKTFRLDSPEIELIAIDSDAAIGALVANWLSEKKIEIRHLAVRQDYRKKSVGKLLIEELFKLVREAAPLQIQTFARNDSVGFYAKLGFKPVGDYLEHEDFTKHGIRFQKMYTELL